MVNTREFKQGPWQGLVQVLATNMDAGISVSDGDEVPTATRQQLG